MAPKAPESNENPASEVETSGALEAKPLAPKSVYPAVPQKGLLSLLCDKLADFGDACGCIDALAQIVATSVFSGIELITLRPINKFSDAFLRRDQFQRLALR